MWWWEKPYPLIREVGGKEVRGLRLRYRVERDEAGELSVREAGHSVDRAGPVAADAFADRRVELQVRLGLADSAGRVREGVELAREVGGKQVDVPALAETP